MAVTDPDLLAGRDLVDAALAAVTGGATCVQLRDKRSTDADFLAVARRLAPALRARGVPLILNDRVHLVAPAGADGAHVGQTDLPVVAARTLLGPTSILGLSIEEIGHESALPTGLVDYVGASPVFATATKTDVGRPLGLAGVRHLADLGLRVVGIGGIHAGNAGSVLRAGAVGVAVVSAIFGTSDPASAARALAEALTSPTR